MKSSFSCVAVAALIASALTACSNPEPPASVGLAWSGVALQADGVIVLRDVANCGDRWWAAGGIRARDGSVRPAAWTGTSQSRWTAVAFEALPASFYGPRQLIEKVACAGERVAMIGAWPGGAHGNPRVSTWRLDDDRMTENAAPFETFGGDTAVDVGELAAAPAGFAVAGNRSSGAAVWLSADGLGFTLHEHATERTVARDVAALPDGRWLIAGGVARAGTADQRAAAWITRDGRSWQPADPPAADGFNEIQRLARDGDDVVAAGLRGTAFGVWRWHAGAWSAAAPFGGDPGGVRSLAVTGGQTVLAGGGLWIDRSPCRTPAPPVAVAARGATLMMATADRLWQTTVPAG